MLSAEDVIPKVGPRLQDPSLRKSLIERVQSDEIKSKNRGWYQTRANSNLQILG